MHVIDGAPIRHGTQGSAPAQERQPTAETAKRSSLFQASIDTYTQTFRGWKRKKTTYVTKAPRTKQASNEEDTPPPAPPSMSYLDDQGVPILVLSLVVLEVVKENACQEEGKGS